MDDGWMIEGNLSVPNRMLNCNLLNFHKIFINLSIELMNSNCVPVYLSILRSTMDILEILYTVAFIIVGVYYVCSFG